MALSKAKIKFLRSLQQKKYRQKYNNFIVEGEKIVDELLRADPEGIEALFALPRWIDTHSDLLKAGAYEVTAISSEELKRISLLQTPNQVLALVHVQPVAEEMAIPERQYALYLEGIRDPGNLGTILRIADWFAIPIVFLSPDCVELHNPKVLQASMGAFLRVHCQYTTLTGLLKKLGEDIPVMGAMLDGANLFEMTLPDRGILVIGSEAQGISTEIQTLLSHRLCIPRSEGGGAESLNAAVATGIICAVLRSG